MIIGSDFDGVIADDTEARISYIKEKYRVDVEPEEIHGSALEKKVGRRAKKDIEIGVNCSEKTMLFQPMPGVSSVFKELISEGDRIIIITGRTKAGISWARKFMETNKIPFHHIWSSKEFFLNPERELQRMISGYDTGLKGKGRIAESVRPAVFVEDSDNHLASLFPIKDKVKLWLFDHPYNRHIFLEGVERVFCWNEIYKKIQALKALQFAGKWQEQ